MNPRVAVQTLLAAALVASAASLASAKPVAVTGTGVTQTHDCAGGDASVAGESNTVTLRHCESVRVMGEGNHVDAGTASAITVLGANNRVTWVRGTREPKVSNLGVGNTVAEATGTGKDGGDAASAKARGSDVAVSGGGGSVTVDRKGNVNIGGEGGAISVDPGGNVSLKPSRDGKDLILNDDGRTTTHDCAGAGAIVNGDSNTLKLRDCRSVVVNGDDNTIDAGAVETIAVHGDSNTVSWRGTKPVVSDDGRRNTIGGK